MIIVDIKDKDKYKDYYTLEELLAKIDENKSNYQKRLSNSCRNFMSDQRQLITDFNKLISNKIMTQQETKEYILIWEFLNNKKFNNENVDWTLHQSNPYKTDWNYLIEAVLKLKSEGFGVDIEYKYCHIYNDAYESVPNTIKEVESNVSTLNAVYSCIVYTLDEIKQKTVEYKNSVINKYLSDNFKDHIDLDDDYHNNKNTLNYILSLLIETNDITLIRSKSHCAIIDKDVQIDIHGDYESLSTLYECIYEYIQHLVNIKKD